MRWLAHFYVPMDASFVVDVKAGASPPIACPANEASVVDCRSVAQRVKESEIIPLANVSYHVKAALPRAVVDSDVIGSASPGRAQTR